MKCRQGVRNNFLYKIPLLCQKKTSLAASVSQNRWQPPTVFHCKANYEAAKRGKWGEFVGKAMSAMREFPYGTIKGGIQDSSDDWEANRRGWRGAKAGKNLLESCSRNPRDYYK